MVVGEDIFRRRVNGEVGLLSRRVGDLVNGWLI